MSGAPTEEASPARVRKAREEGDSGASTYATGAIALGAAIAVLPATFAAAGARVETQLREAIGHAAMVEVGAHIDATEVASEIATITLPLLVAVAVTAAAAQLVQSGGFVWARRSGRGLFGHGAWSFGASGRGLFAIVRTIGGGVLVAFIVGRALRVHAADLARTAGRLAFAGPAATAITRAIGWQVAVAGLAIAVLDIVVERAAWSRRLRMSRDEKRREHAEEEGDASMKHAREAARAEIVAWGAIADVERARLVVWDGSQTACAIEYEERDRAPVVVAIGEGPRAAVVVEAAEKHGVAVRNDPALARALAGVNAGDLIPEALYDAVADLLRDLVPPSKP